MRMNKTFLHTQTHTHTQTHANVRTSTHTLTHTYATHARTHAHTHTRTCTHTLMHKQSHTYACTQAHTHTRTHARARTHARTHTHTHTHTHDIVVSNWDAYTHRDMRDATGSHYIIINIAYYNEVLNVCPAHLLFPWHYVILGKRRCFRFMFLHNSNVFVTIIKWDCKHQTTTRIGHAYFDNSKKMSTLTNFS